VEEGRIKSNLKSPLIPLYKGERLIENLDIWFVPLFSAFEKGRVREGFKMWGKKRG
jgi:hypothetical protein